MASENISDNKITFLLNDIDLSGSLDISATVLEGLTEETMSGDVILVGDISLSDLEAIFKFQTDASNIDDISNVDLKFHQDFINNTKLFDKIMSCVTEGTGGAFNIPSDLSMAFEYVQFIALNVFGTRKGVDIFDNEDELVNELYNKQAAAFTTFFDGNTNTNYNEQEPETGVFRRIAHKLFQTIMRLDGSRVDISNSLEDTNGFQPIPFESGDTLVMKYTVNDDNVHAADLTNNNWDASQDQSRSYLIKLTVV